MTRIGYLAMPQGAGSTFWSRRATTTPGSLTRTDFGLEPDVIELDADNGYPLWLRDVASSLNALGHLTSDWDSYGARAPSAKSVRAAVRLLVDLIDEASYEVPAPTVFPNPAGSLSLEWANGDRSIEFEVFPGGEVTVVVDDHGEVDEWETGLLVSDDLREQLRQLLVQ